MNHDRLWQSTLDGRVPRTRGDEPDSTIDSNISSLRSPHALWKAGDVTKVNSFLDQAGLARDALFAQLIQALIEPANRDGKGDEAPILESISNHLRSRAGISSPAQALLL
jgi:hypothetical protein